MGKTLIYTDGSKELDSGKTAAGVFIPCYDVAIKERASDHLTVFTVELLAKISICSGYKDIQNKMLLLYQAASQLFLVLKVESQYVGRIFCLKF